MSEVGKHKRIRTRCANPAAQRDYRSCVLLQLQAQNEQYLAHPNHLGEPAASDSIRALRNATKE